MPSHLQLVTPVSQALPYFPSLTHILTQHFALLGSYEYILNT